jgi:hypothetical protein
MIPIQCRRFPKAVLKAAGVNFAWICSLPIGFTVALAQTPRTKTPPAPGPSYSEPAFLRTVSIDGIGMPLREVVNKLSGAVRLTCGKNCEELKVQMRVREKPLSSVMKSLAELVPGDWKSDGGGTGYTLEMSPEWTAKRARWWSLYNAARQRGLEAMRQALKDELEKPFDERHEIDGPGLREQIVDEHSFFTSLPEAIRKRIVDRLDEVSFFRSHITFSGDDVELHTALPISQFGGEQRAIILRRLASMYKIPPETLPIDQAVVLFKNGGWSMSVSVLLPGLGSNGVLSCSPQWPMEAMTMRLDHHVLPQFQERLGRAAPAGWKPFVEFAKSKVWTCDLPPRPANIMQSPQRRAETLARITEQSRIDFIADYYSVPGTHMPPSERKAPLVGDLKANLDLWGFLQDSSWKKGQDGIHLMRNNRWYRDDELEVPAKLVARWLAIKESEQAEPKKPRSVLEAVRNQLDWEAEIVAQLSRYQMSCGFQWTADEKRADPDAAKPEEQQAFSLNSMFFPFYQDAQRVQGEYHTARFYGSLSSEQRASLIEGRLSAHSLTQAQYDLALALTPELGIASPNGAVLGLSYPANPTQRSWEHVRLRVVTPNP